MNTHNIHAAEFAYRTESTPSSIIHITHTLEKEAS